MAERSSYVPGTPCWVDLGAADTAAAARFYGGLFGWEAATDPRPEAGGYGMFTLRGRNVAGLGPQTNPDAPPYWTVYVSVADIEATAARISARGGEVLAGPMEVFDAGKLLAAQDAVGSYISAWQPGAHIGAQLVNEPGAFTWNELATTDLPRARDFYMSVFGWDEQGEEGNDQATIFTTEGNIICGAHTAGEGEFPAWSVWFSVEDCDSSASKATDLGGSVLMPPTDMDFGRGAVVADPQGAVFGVGVLNEETQATAN